MGKKVKFSSTMNYLRVVERILKIIKNIMVASEPKLIGVYKLKLGASST